MVLEVPDEGENSKATSDSDRCSWTDLMHELMEMKVSDPTINGHELVGPLTDEGVLLSFSMIYHDIV